MWRQRSSTRKIQPTTMYNYYKFMICPHWADHEFLRAYIHNRCIFDFDLEKEQKKPQ